MRRTITLQPSGEYAFDIGRNALILILRNATQNVVLKGDSLTPIELSRSDIVHVNEFRNKRMFLSNENAESITVEFQLSDTLISIREQRMAIDGGVVVDEIVKPVEVSQVHSPINVGSVAGSVQVSSVATPVQVSEITAPVQVSGIAEPIRVAHKVAPERTVVKGDSSRSFLAYNVGLLCLIEGAEEDIKNKHVEVRLKGMDGNWLAPLKFKHGQMLEFNQGFKGEFWFSTQPESNDQNCAMYITYHRDL